MARSAKINSNPPISDNSTPPTSKIEAVVALLRRQNGATLGEITGATGWQPHSARAVLTGLRKKGHVLDKTKRDETTCYRIVEPA